MYTFKDISSQKHTGTDHVIGGYLGFYSVDWAMVNGDIGENVRTHLMANKVVVAE